MIKMMKYFVLVIAAWIGLASSQNTDYCKFSPKHTLCKFTGRGPRCGNNVQESGVNAEDMSVIVATHNQLRAKVARGEETLGMPGPQPAAAEMRLMKWDDELARVAQGHADKCVFEHDCGDCRRVERFSAGQNLYISFANTLDLQIEWSKVIHSWYDEVKDFPNTNVDPFVFTEKTGHYSQVLWSQSSFIGCGYTMFFDEGWWKKLYTCNYGPAGNFIGNKMYLRGAHCSSCPAGTTCSAEYPGLCADTNDAGNTLPATPPTTTTTTTTTVPQTPNEGGMNNILQIFNGFKGLVDLNSIMPDNKNLESLANFFNSFRDTLITAPPATTPNTTPAPAVETPPQQPPPEDPADKGVVGGGLDAILNAFSPAKTSEEESATIISVTSTGPPSAITPATNLNNEQWNNETPTPNENLSQFEQLMAALFSSTPPPIEPQADEIDLGMTPTTMMTMMTDSQNLTHMESNREPDEKLTLMSILMRAGRRTQVIRASSLDDAHKIIEELGEDVNPIVVHRSKTGELTELDPITLTPLPSRSQRFV